MPRRRPLVQARRQFSSEESVFYMYFTPLSSGASLEAGSVCTSHILGRSSIYRAGTVYTSRKLVFYQSHPKSQDFFAFSKWLWLLYGACTLLTPLND